MKHFYLALLIVLLSGLGCLVAQTPTEPKKLLQTPENATFNPLTGEMTLKLKVTFSGNYNPDYVNEALEQVYKDINPDYLLDETTGLKITVIEKSNSLTFNFP